MSTTSPFATSLFATSLFTTSLAVTWFPAFAGGAILGLVFFEGLWWTVTRGTSGRGSPWWFLVSFVVRMSVVLGGVFFIAHGHLDRLLACLLGFLVMRSVVVRFHRAPEMTRTPRPRSISGGDLS